MSEKAHLRVGDFATINFGDHRRGGSVFHVIEPGLDGETIPAGVYISEAQKLRGGWRICPCLRLKFTWLAGNLQRIHAGADEIDDAAEVQIRADDVTELFA